MGTTVSPVPRIDGQGYRVPSLNEDSVGEDGYTWSLRTQFSLRNWSPYVHEPYPSTVSQTSDWMSIGGSTRFSYTRRRDSSVVVRLLFHSGSYSTEKNNLERHLSRPEGICELENWSSNPSKRSCTRRVSIPVFTENRRKG